MEGYLQKLGINVNFPFILIVAGLIWARVLSVFSVIPFLFGKPTPRLARIGSSIVVTIFLYPILSQGLELTADFNQLRLLALFLKEILFGMAIGFSASILFHGLQAAGQMIDNQRGVSLARILIPELGEQSSISGNLLFQFAVVIFLTLGGHRFLLTAMAQSFQILPILEFPKSVQGLLPMMELFMVMTGRILWISVQIAAPVIIAILLADIILGVANRFAPQINVWELGFNIRGYIGILMLFLSIGFVASQIEEYTIENNKNIRDVIQAVKEKPPPQPAKETPALELPIKVIPMPKMGN